MRRWWIGIGVLTALLCGLFFLSSEEEAKAPPIGKVVLEMVLMGDCQGIEESIASAKPLIDRWAILDVGAPTSVRQRALSLLRDLPGRLIEKPVKELEEGRKELKALAKASGAYSLLLDPEDRLVVQDKTLDLQHDLYTVTLLQGELEGRKPLLVRNKEGLDSVSNGSGILLQGIVCQRNPSLRKKEAYLLEASLLQQKECTSHEAFVVADCYMQAGEYYLALGSYQDKVAKGGDDEEMFWSLLQIAKLQEALLMPPQVVIDSYKVAHEKNTSRLEPLYWLGFYLLREKRYEEAYATLKKAEGLSLPQDFLFVEPVLYRWGLRHKLAAVCLQQQNYGEFKSHMEGLLSVQDLPPPIRTECVNNLGVLRQMGL